MARSPRIGHCPVAGCGQPTARFVCHDCWERIPADTRIALDAAAREQRWQDLIALQQQTVRALGGETAPASAVAPETTYRNICRLTGEHDYEEAAE